MLPQLSTQQVGKDHFSLICDKVLPFKTTSVPAPDMCLLYLRKKSDFKKVLKHLWQTLWVPSQEPSLLFVEDRSQVPSLTLKRQQSAMSQGMSQR